MKQDPLRITYNDKIQPVLPAQVKESAVLYQKIPEKKKVRNHPLPNKKEKDSQSRYRFEKYGHRSWAVYDGDELIAVTVYKKGAKTVVDRLEAYEKKVKPNYSWEHLERNQKSGPEM